ncbi:hypothetical protein EIP91_003354 [Steccherinum ochraceum]|uniref:Uncharacterized protein n=1 Tax=Steccherinum ochraceum TaxID=92696 RepID=A0A4R0RMC6_9APHY|nr:hypothetical protein EIP91_003354 [Steccherinum ochraceum]
MQAVLVNAAHGCEQTALSHADKRALNSFDICADNVHSMQTPPVVDSSSSTSRGTGSDEQRKDHLARDVSHVSLPRLHRVYYLTGHTNTFRVEEWDIPVESRLLIQESVCFQASDPAERATFPTCHKKKNRAPIKLIGVLACEFKWLLHVLYHGPDDFARESNAVQIDIWTGLLSVSMHLRFDRIVDLAVASRKVREEILKSPPPESICWYAYGENLDIGYHNWVGSLIEEIFWPTEQGPCRDLEDSDE